MDEVIELADQYRGPTALRQQPIKMFCPLIRFPLTYEIYRPYFIQTDSKSLSLLLAQYVQTFLYIITFVYICL